jgi:hypothetical protein
MISMKNLKCYLIACLLAFAFSNCLKAETNNAQFILGEYAEIGLQKSNSLYSLYLFPLLKIDSFNFNKAGKVKEPELYSSTDKSDFPNYFSRAIKKKNETQYLETISYEVESPTVCLSYVNLLSDAADCAFSFEIDLSFLNVESLEKEVQYSFDRSLNAILINFLKYQKSYAIGTNAAVKDLKFEKKESDLIEVVCNFKCSENEAINFVFTQLNFHGNLIQSLENFNNLISNPEIIIESASNYWKALLDSSLSLITPDPILNRLWSEKIISEKFNSFLKKKIEKAKDLNINYESIVQVKESDSTRNSLNFNKLINIDSIAEYNIKISTFFPANWDSTILKNYEIANHKIFMKMLRLPERTRFYFEKADTSHLKIDLEPLYPFGTVFGTAMINGIPYKAKIEETENALVPKLPIILRAVTVVDVYHTKGISLLPLQKFYAFKDDFPYKIISTSFNENIYSIIVEGAENSNFEFELYCKDFEIESIENATIKKQQDENYIIELRFPKSKQNFSQVFIEIKVK